MHGYKRKQSLIRPNLHNFSTYSIKGVLGHALEFLVATVGLRHAWGHIDSLLASLFTLALTSESEIVTRR